jgi:predicted ATPase with chaperone activity
MKSEKIEMELVEANAWTRWPCNVCNGTTEKAAVLCEGKFTDSDGANSLSEVVNFLRGEAPLEPAAGQLVFTPSKSDDDFAEVHGQQHVKRAVEVAAAGAHNLLIFGPIPWH